MKYKTQQQIEEMQKKQDKFLWELCNKVLDIEFKSQGTRSLSFALDLICNDCKNCGIEERRRDAKWTLHTAEGAMQWLGHHKGHDTWITYIRG